ncbi:MAG: EAL domain-containing protein [Chloroflexota bacterium]
MTRSRAAQAAPPAYPAAEHHPAGLDGLLRAQQDAGVAVAVLASGQFVWSDRCFQALVGRDGATLTHLASAQEIVVPEHRAAFQRRLRSGPRKPGQKTLGTLRIDLLGPNGRPVPVEIGVSASRFGSARQHILVVRPASTANIQRRMESRVSRLIRDTSDIILLLDNGGQILWQSPSVERVLGYPPGALEGTDLLRLLHPEDSTAADDLLDGARHAAEPQSTSVVLRALAADGEWRHLDTVVRSELDHPDVRGLVLTALDVTDRKNAEDQQIRQAFHDPLTGLPNRLLFTYCIQRGLATAQRERAGVAVMFLDLDRFKVINDSLGHGVGDELLVALGNRLRACVRPGDTVARLGGDEFTILLENITHPDEAVVVARRIIDRLSEPFDLSGRELYVTSSIGIALGNADTSTSDDLMRFADVAMYRAKTGGKARYVVFDGSMHADWVARLNLETDLRRAIDRGELRVLYQPLINLRTGRVIGVEALARWQHPDRGLVSPAEFIPMAEETGLIVPIGQWVLTEACRQVKTWQQRLKHSESLAVSVNISARQFQQPELVETVERALWDSKLDPELLHLEITESIVMDDAVSTGGKIDAIKALGVRLDMDDFGTGYSSLSYLRRLPVGIIKLDRSFVSGLGGSDPTTLSIVEAITRLAHALGMEVAAEGIETESQLRLLCAAGCDRGQGYLFARPLTADQIAELIQSGRSFTSFVRTSAA